MALDSMQEIFDKIQAGRKPFWQVVRDTDVEERQVTAEASFEKMHATWRAMVESVEGYDPAPADVTKKLVEAYQASKA